VIRQGKRILSFNGFLWICVSVIVIWLLAAPIVMNEWARRTWKEIPCHLNAPGGANTEFYYEVDGQRYLSTRVDFWQAHYDSEKRRPLGETESNSTCWISPRGPEGAVLRLDAMINWPEAAHRLTIAGLVAAVVGGITWFGGKRPSKK
jgi:hypothetical protein